MHSFIREIKGFNADSSNYLPLFTNKKTQLNEKKNKSWECRLKLNVCVTFTSQFGLDTTEPKHKLNNVNNLLSRPAIKAINSYTDNPLRKQAFLFFSFFLLSNTAYTSNFPTGFEESMLACIYIKSDHNGVLPALRSTVDFEDRTDFLSDLAAVPGLALAINRQERKKVKRYIYISRLLKPCEHEKNLHR